jgi:prepilin peptidase CpaA
VGGVLTDANVRVAAGFREQGGTGGHLPGRERGAAVFDGIVLARHVCLLALAVTCAYTDLARGKLYNVVTLGGLAFGLALAYLLDAAASHTDFHLPLTTHLVRAALGAALGGGVLFLLYLAGGFDAGDVKMMTAVGALGTPTVARSGPADPYAFIIWALFYTALAGAMIGLGLLIWRGRLRQGIKDSLRALVSFRKPRREGISPDATMPYGLAIAIGTIWAWLECVL